MPSKECSKCGLNKSIDNFYKKSSSKQKLTSQCKVCISKRGKVYRDKNREQICRRKREYHKKIRIKDNERRKAHYELNKETELKHRKEYYQKNKTKINEYNKNYIRKRRFKDPVFKIRMDVSSHIRKAIKKTGGQKGGKTFEALPYTPQELREHIEKQFDEKMNWDNYGDYWHIDHIIPQAALPYKSLEDENFQKCWDLKNLRPLEAKENMSKGSLYEGERRTYTNNKEIKYGYQKDTG